ncbi:AfsR/SARP family transcriptional regulator [Salininema proteolyticum]|uniref:BTAD domain-containing putative transcriptional regulator n=1 Tax=Salininema proteolyticum TaxID=1607685 RepID=A0ABV8TVI4_9ACTN
MIRIRLLGSIQAFREGREVPSGTPQQRLVLARLALAEGRAVSADTLCEILWGDRIPASAASTLQSYVSRLRSALGRDAVVRQGGGYRLVDTDTDVAEYDRLCERASRADAAEAEMIWRTALALFDEPLPGLPGPWAEAQREFLRRRHRRNLIACATGPCERGGEERLDLIVRLRRDDPFREDLLLAHLRTLDALGRRGEALALYLDMRSRMVEEQGLEPGREVKRFHRRLLAGEPAREDALSVPPRPREFVGRESILRRFTSHLETAAGGAPVYSVHGPAGIGKSSLAVEAAYRARGRFPDGVVFVNARGADERPLDVGTVLAQTLLSLGVPPEDIPADSDGQVALLHRRLRGRRVLLIVDNVFAVSQIDRLIPREPGCATVITSRAPLPDVAGEEVSLGGLSEGEGIDLLCRLAGAERVLSEVAAARSLVDMSGRYPLAVSLMGSRLAASPGLGLAEFLGVLKAVEAVKDVPSERTGVRAALIASNRYLDADLMVRYRLLSIPDLDEITVEEAAAATGRSLGETESDLAEFVGLSMLIPASDGRYRFHDLLREYIQSYASAPERRQVLEEILDLHLAQAVAARNLHDPDSPHLQTLPTPATPYHAFADGTAALAWLASFPPRTLRVLRQALEAPRFPFRLGLSVIQALEWLAEHYPNSELIRQSLERIAILASESEDDRALAKVLQIAANMFGSRSGGLNDPGLSTACARKSFRLAVEVGDDLTAGHALRSEAFLRFTLREYSPAIELQTRAIEHYRRAGAEASIANSLAERSRAKAFLGRYGEAIAEVEDSVALIESVPGRDLHSGILYTYGVVLLMAGRPDEGVGKFAESLTVSNRAERDKRWAALTHMRMADCRLSSGDLRDCERLCAEAVAVAERIGDGWTAANTLLIWARARELGGDDAGAARLRGRVADSPVDKAILEVPSR